MGKDFTRMGAITTDLKTGLAFCTRLPISAPDASIAQASWTFPVVGAVVGLIGALVFWLGEALSLPPLVATTLAVAATALMTGCLHEDGLADTADGFGGGASAEQSLEIMRDSRIGTYGVAALILSFLIRVGAVASLAASGLAGLALIGAHAGARASLPLFMRSVPPARSEGLAAHAGAPSAATACGAAALGLLILAICLGIGTGLLAALLVVAGLIGMARLTLKKIGGQTGDVLGAVEQMGEVLILLTAAALW